MDDMDFTKPHSEPAAASAPFKAAQSRFYDSAAAAKVFREAGKEERFGAGQGVFEEDEKARGGLFSKASTRMYFLAEGEVALSMRGKPLDVVKAGEVFGEMAVISGQPRSASAAARGDVVAFSMDAAELQRAIAKHPEFALMLASVMYDRLRFLAARLASRPSGSAAPREATVFDSSLVSQLESALPKTAIVRHRQETIIFKEGQAGTFMYLVKAGRVGIAVGANIVEVVGPGGTFGEMAVVDQSPRTARAGSIDEVELLAVDRNTLVELIRKNPAFAMALMKGVADRLRHMNAQLR
jgi:CRP-like cAMP-binding protein